MEGAWGRRMLQWAQEREGRAALWESQGPSALSQFLPCLDGAQTSGPGMILGVVRGSQSPQMGERRAWRGHGQPALQHNPIVLICPLGFLIPPKATTPIVLVVGCLWGLKPLFLVIPTCLSEHCSKARDRAWRIWMSSSQR